MPYRLPFATKLGMRLFINLTPLIPLSFSRRGGRDFREGLRPSLTYTPSSLKEVDEVLA